MKYNKFFKMIDPPKRAFPPLMSASPQGPKIK